LLVAFLDYRSIFWIMAVVIAAAAAYISFWLRDQMASDWSDEAGPVKVETRTQ
jgi:hypothetical protein